MCFNWVLRLAFFHKKQHGYKKHVQITDYPDLPMSHLMILYPLVIRRNKNRNDSANEIVNRVFVFQRKFNFHRFKNCAAHGMSVVHVKISMDVKVPFSFIEKYTKYWLENHWWNFDQTDFTNLCIPSAHQSHCESKHKTKVQRLCSEHC